jgi:hypothetical protein
MLCGAATGVRWLADRLSALTDVFEPLPASRAAVLVLPSEAIAPLAANSSVAVQSATVVNIPFMQISFSRD